MANIIKTDPNQIIEMKPLLNTLNQAASFANDLNTKLSDDTFMSKISQVLSQTTDKRTVDPIYKTLVTDLDSLRTSLRNASKFDPENETLTATLTKADLLAFAIKFEAGSDQGKTIQSGFKQINNNLKFLINESSKRALRR